MMATSWHIRPIQEGSMTVFKGPQTLIQPSHANDHERSSRAIGIALAVGSSLLVWLGLAMVARCVVGWFT